MSDFERLCLNGGAGPLDLTTFSRPKQGWPFVTRSKQSLPYSRHESTPCLYNSTGKAKNVLNVLFPTWALATCDIYNEDLNGGEGRGGDRVPRAWFYGVGYSYHAACQMPVQYTCAPTIKFQWFKRLNRRYKQSL